MRSCLQFLVMYCHPWEYGYWGLSSKQACKPWSYASSKLRQVINFYLLRPQNQTNPPKLLWGWSKGRRGQRGPGWNLSWRRWTFLGLLVQQNEVLARGVPTLYTTDEAEAGRLSMIGLRGWKATIFQRRFSLFENVWCLVQNQLNLTCIH